MLGFRGMLMGSSSLTTVVAVATDPYFPYVQALAQPSASDVGIYDYSGKGGTAKSITLSGGASVSTAQSAVFGGSTLYINGVAGSVAELADHTDWDFGSGNFRGAFEWMPDGPSIQAGIVLGQGFDSRSWMIWQYADGRIELDVSTSGSAWAQTVTSAAGAIVAGQKAYVEFGRVGNNIYISVNGVVSSAAFSGTIFNSNLTLRVGSHYGGATHYPVKGHFKNIVVEKGGEGPHTANFTPPTTIPTNRPYGVLLVTLASGSAVDITAGRGRTVTISGGAAASSTGVFSGYGSIPLDGTDDNLSTPLPATSGDWTMEALVTITENRIHTLASSWNSWTSALDFDFYITSGGAPKLVVGDGGPVTITATSIVPLNVPTLVVAQRSGNTFSLSVAGTTPITATATTPLLARYTPYIGRSFLGEYLKGSLHSFRYTHAARYAGTVPVPTAAWPTQ